MLRRCVRKYAGSLVLASGGSKSRVETEKFQVATSWAPGIERCVMGVESAWRDIHVAGVPVLFGGAAESPKICEASARTCWSARSGRELRLPGSAQLVQMSVAMTTAVRVLAKAMHGKKL